MPAHVRSAPLLTRAVLQRLDGGTVDDLSTLLTTYVDNGGLALRRGDSAWSGATVHDEREAEELLLRLDGVTGRAWQQSRQALIDLMKRAGLPQPVDLAGWTSVLALLTDVERSALTHGLDVHCPELDRRCAVAGDWAWRRRHPTPDGWWRRRALRKELLARRRGGPCDRMVLFSELGAAVAERDAWRELAGNPSAVPRVIGL